MVNAKIHVRLHSCPIGMEGAQLANAKLVLPILIPAQVAFLRSPTCIIVGVIHCAHKGHMPILHLTVLTAQTIVSSVLPNQFAQSAKRTFICSLILVNVYQTVRSAISQQLILPQI